MNLKKQWAHLLIPFALVFVCGLSADRNHSRFEAIDTFYGTISSETMSEDEATLIASLLNSSAVNRLKSINQYGPIQIVDSQGQNSEPFTRYDHSLGVFYLLRRFGAPFPEQISGLLHDLPHSAFSHVSDYLFSDHSAGDPDYHDSRFITFVNKHGVADILSSHQLSPEAVDAKNNPAFTRLERALPDLAADRLDYIVQGAARRNDLSGQQVHTILADLLFDPQSEHWYSISLTSARLLGDASIELNRKVFATAWGRMLYLWTADALKLLIAAGELSYDDIFFTMGDHELWQTVQHSHLTSVQPLALQMGSAWHKVHEVRSPDKASLLFEQVRCRIVNPRVVTVFAEDNAIISWQRVSDLDPEFQQRYDQEQKRCQRFYALIEP